MASATRSNGKRLTLGTNAGTNGSKKLTKSNGRNKLRKDEERGIWKWIIGLIVLTILTLSMGFIYQKMYASPSITKISVVLRRFVKTAYQRIDYEMQMQILLLEDPLVDIMKTGLRPIQERVTSLRTQTSQYEKMQHIPGGPTNFMSTALKELNSDIQGKLLQLTTESMTLLKEVSLRANAVAKNGQKMVVSGALLLDELSLRLLAIEGGIIIPESNADPVLINQLADQVTFEEVTIMLNTLASLYEEVEEAVTLALTIAEQMNTSIGIKISNMMDFAKVEMDLTDEEYEHVLPYFEEIKIKRAKVTEYRKQNGKYLQLFQHLNTRNSERLMAMLTRLQNYQDDKQRPFIQLHGLISKDVQNLKVRIENLKYKYAKRSTEL